MHGYNAEMYCARLMRAEAKRVRRWFPRESWAPAIVRHYFEAARYHLARAREARAALAAYRGQS